MNEKLRLNFRVGIEEEGFTLNHLGFLAPYSYLVAEELLDIIQEDANTLRKIRSILLGLQWEPHPSQLEYVTHPLKPENLYNTLKYSREILGRCAQKKGLLMGFFSMHPIQSTPLPINGTHINISYTGIGEARRLSQLNYVTNYLRNYMPEIIAATANTPIYRGVYNGYTSNRLRLSRVLKKSEYNKLVIKPFRIIPPTMRERFRYGILFERIRKYIRRIEVNKEGDRLLDLTVRGPHTNIVEDLFKSPDTTRIEVRMIDNQLNLNYLNDIICILLGLIYEGLENYEKGKELKKRPQLDRLREAAIKNGVDAISEEGVKLGDRLKEIVERIEPNISHLGLKLRSKLKHGIPEAKQNKVLIQDSYPEATKLKIDGYIWMKIKTNKTRNIIKITGEKEKIPPGTYQGIIVPEYSLEYEGDDGILKKITKIYIKHYIYTGEGYIEIDQDDDIVASLKPAERLIQVTTNTINQYITTL